MHNPVPPQPSTERDVDEAVKESFPASDPPSYMGGTTAAPTAATVAAAHPAANGPGAVQGGDVDEASKESFPASDPPSFMSGSTAAPTAATLGHAAALTDPAATVTVYRVVGEGQRAKPFGAEAASGGGRWTSEATPALYAAQSPATALLEFLAHCEGTPPDQVWLASARIPRDRLERLATPPAAWRERPYRADVRRVGDDWARSHRSLALEVPSALCEDAYNVILNPGHVDAPLLQHVEVQPIRIDERLRRTPG